ncbi:hypothetical protein BU25DRAFT_75984 [Macroventuria anomochaeta]|uniref:Uncharacterized protein n=1 Tax=Macroventuria anomochaeta TaxID=301207 RepID=A0ACB6RYA8_9PLEO|nr:uncharacterized protein BU25DRAFT_75984 [Macroventuria anomochaeta]KAF2626970.1 hypothetical protein BU25DRAFT_75984 [Macroventuria anomochaeta]
MLSCDPALSLALYFTTSAFGRTFNTAPNPKRSLLIPLPDYGTSRVTKFVANLLETITLSKPVDAWLGVEYSTRCIIVPEMYRPLELGSLL